MRADFMVLSCLVVCLPHAFPWNHNAIQKKARSNTLNYSPQEASSPGLSLIEWDDDMNIPSELHNDNKAMFSNIDGRFVKHLFTQTFLPSGFPDSVPEEYGTFQKWNLIQDVCSYFRGIMMTKALLSGMGVGRADTTAARATIIWILRDGASMIGGLAFTALNSYNFGQDVKKWRFFADSINNVGITLNMIAPMFPSWFLPLLCLGSLCTTLCGIAAGATNAAINAHWGSNGNIAEILAKNGAQHTAVSLIGLVVSIPFTSIVEKLPPYVSWLLFVLLTFIHMVSNYHAMKVLALTSVNIVRYQLLMETFFRRYPPQLTPMNKITHQLDISASSCFMFSPAMIAVQEPVIPYAVPFISPKKSRVTPWARVTSSIDTNTIIKTFSGCSTATESLQTCSIERINSSYIFLRSENNSFQLYFAHGVSFENQAKALFTAFILEKNLSMTLTEAISYTEELFPLFWDILKTSGWQLDVSSLRPPGAKTYVVH